MNYLPNIINNLHHISCNLKTLANHVQDIHSGTYDNNICSDLSSIASELNNTITTIQNFTLANPEPLANELPKLSTSIEQLSSTFSNIVAECSDNHTVNCIDTSYISLVNNIINNGYDTDNTRMLPMQCIRANNIAESFPVVQHKKLFVKGVWEELMFFLHSYRDVRILQSKGVHIWDANADPKYKKLHNKHLEDYDLGPIYGCQWRNFNGKQCDNNQCDHHDCNNQCDQLQSIVNNIKNHSLSRRLFMSAWNPQQLDEMVLPPCHVSYHFIPYIKNDVYTVDLMVYQRSADVMLGLPFNIASSSFLLLLVCKYCGVSAGDVCICIGNAHIYKEHFKSLNKVKEATNNIKYSNVTATITGDLSGSFDQFIDSVKYQLHNYNVTNTIKFDLVV